MALHWYAQLDDCAAAEADVLVREVGRAMAAAPILPSPRSANGRAGDQPLLCRRDAFVARLLTVCDELALTSTSRETVELARRVGVHLASALAVDG